VGIDSVGVIGLGATGGALARRLLDQGLQVTVHDRDPWKVAELVVEGARPARIPADAAEPADLVFVHVPTEIAVEEVIFDCGGIGETLREGGFVVIAGRTSATFIHSAAGRLGEFGINTIEASLTGDVGRAGATLLVGCDHPEDLKTIAPTLTAVADDIVRVGPVGSVAAMRLVRAVSMVQPVPPVVASDERTSVEDRCHRPSATLSVSVLREFLDAVEVSLSSGELMQVTAVLELRNPTPLVRETLPCPAPVELDA
jgi:hypothetical protein